MTMGENAYRIPHPLPLTYFLFRGRIHGLVNASGWMWARVHFAFVLLRIEGFEPIKFGADERRWRGLDRAAP